MGSKADDVSHGGATAAVLLDDPATEMKRDGSCVVNESKDKAARSAEAAGKFGSIGAPHLRSFCVSSEDTSTTQGGLRGGGVVSAPLPTCSQTAPMIDWLPERKSLVRLPCIYLLKKKNPI